MDKIQMDSLEHQIEEIFTVHKGYIYRQVIEDTTKTLIEKALEHSHGNQIAAAKVLGLNRNTLRTKIKKLNISTEKFR